MKSIIYVNRKEVADKVIKKVVSSKKARIGVAGVVGVNTAVDTFVKVGCVVGVLTMSGLTAGLMTPIGLGVVFAGIGLATIGWSIYKTKDSLRQMSEIKEQQIRHAEQLAKIASLQDKISAAGVDDMSEQKVNKTVVEKNLKSILVAKASWLKSNVYTPVMNIKKQVLAVKGWVFGQIKNPIYLILEVVAHADKISVAKLGLATLFFAVTGLTGVIGISTLVAIFAVFVILRLANEGCKYMFETYNTTLKADIEKAENTIKDLTRDQKIVSLKTQLSSKKQCSSGSRKSTTPLFDSHASKPVVAKRHQDQNRALRACRAA